MLEYSSEEEFIGLQGTNGVISAAQVPEEPFHHKTSCLSYDSTYVLEAFFYANLAFRKHLWNHT